MVWFLLGLDAHVPVSRQTCMTPQPQLTGVMAAFRGRSRGGVQLEEEQVEVEQHKAPKTGV